MNVILSEAKDLAAATDMGSFASLRMTVRPFFLALLFLLLPAPSGITSKMDEKNHHLHKSVFIGEIKADGQFNVVWKTPGPVKAQPWSPYIPENKGKKDEPEKK